MSSAEQSFTENIHVLRSLLPGMREGDAEAIHDARIATRRLRTVLPTVVRPGSSAPWDQLAEVIRTTNRILGRTRDIDAELDLLAEFERRAPATAPAVAAVRAHLLELQLRRRRELIKHLESIDFDALWRVAGNHLPSRRRFGAWLGREVGVPLVGAIADQALELRGAMDHASGVYFPRRAHAVRVSAKKLRYLVELLDKRVPVRRPTLKVLRDAQEALGEIHDREVLEKRVRRLRRRESVPQARAFEQLLRAESRDFFATYLTVRDKIAAADDALLRWSDGSPSRSRRLGAGALKVGAVALPSAAVVILAHRLPRSA
jgi:CHAD domain-containing protein